MCFRNIYDDEINLSSLTHHVNPNVYDINKIIQFTVYPRSNATTISSYLHQKYHLLFEIYILTKHQVFIFLEIERIQNPI